MAEPRGEGGVELVQMAQIGIVTDGRRLKTTLGSCVGVVLHDGRRSMSGLAHIMLPSPLRGDEAVGKYAETAIPALYQRLVERGCRPEDLRAFLTGGADMFRSSTDSRIATIGSLNIEAARAALLRLGVPVSYEETGGSRGRTVVFDNATGSIEVKTLAPVVVPGGAS